MASVDGLALEFSDRRLAPDTLDGIKWRRG
jgi:hypothetical protein